MICRIQSFSDVSQEEEDGTGMLIYHEFSLLFLFVTELYSVINMLMQEVVHQNLESTIVVWIGKLPN